MRPPQLATAAFVTLAALATACSSGGGGAANNAGGGAAAAPADPAGTWNLFRQGNTCTGDEFAALLMQIRDTGNGTFEVVIGAPGEELRFAGTLDDGRLSLTGTATAGDLTIELESDPAFPSFFLLDDGGNTMSGAMQVNRTEAGAKCEFTDFVSAFRADATDQSPAAAAWVWNTEVVEANGDCIPAVGEAGLILAELFPQREDEFTLDLVLDDGDNFQVGARIEGSDLVLFGDDADLADSIELEVLGRTSLQIDLATLRIGGQLEFVLRTPQPDGSVKECSLLLTVVGSRASDFLPTTESLLTFLADIPGEQRLVAVDNQDADRQLDLDGNLAFPGVQFASEVPDFTGVSVRGEFDEATGVSTSAQADRVFYIRGENILAQDLVQRRNGAGTLLPPTPVTIVEGSPNPSNLQVFSHPGSSLIIVTHESQTVSGAFVVDQSTRIAEIAADGSVTEDVLSPDGSILFDTLDPATGELRGVIVETQGGGLARVLANESQTISASAATFPTRAADGSVFFFADGQVSVYDSRTEEVDQLGALTGDPVAVAIFGTEFFILHEDDNFPGALRLTRAVKNTMGLLGPFYNPTADLDAFLLATPSRVVVQYQESPAVRRFFSVDRDGNFVDLALDSDFDFGAAGDFAQAFRMGEFLFLQPEAPGKQALALKSDGSAQARLGDRWLGPVADRTETIGQQSEPTGLLYRDGDVLKIVDANSPLTEARSLGDVDLVLPSGLTFVDVTAAPGSGSRMLISVNNRVVFVDATEANSAVVVESGNVSAPIF